MNVSDWSTLALIAAFALSAVVIAVAGTRMTGAADTLSSRTGLGQALFGAIFLGGVTSLPGIVTSIVAAAQGNAELAVSNALGGIAAQTAFLAVADMSFRKANLEHAAANVANLLQAALLMTLVALPIVGASRPDIELFAVHPVSGLVIAGYVFGLFLIRQAQTEPTWLPERTNETAPDEEEDASRIQDERSLAQLWTTFAALAAVTAVAGYAIATVGGQLAARTGLSQSAVGALLTATATSLPELVTSVAAVRRGALTLAVGDILGGNSFDVLFVAAADIAYRDGSIYAAIGDNELFIMALTILLTGVLMLGLLRREKHGVANIGFESFLVVVLYLSAVAVLLVS